MGAADAATAQGMATRHRRSVKALQNGVGEVNALLAKMIKVNKIKWGGYGTHALWYVRKLKETSSWETGQLGTRSFEEKDPVDEATLPYCFISETYGVSEKSIKTNRAAGELKLYDIQKENTRNAQNAMYRAFSAACYSTGADSLQPHGLMKICGNAFEDSSDGEVSDGATYAGIYINNSGAVINTSTVKTAATPWTNEYWHPYLQNVHQMATTGALTAWGTGCVYYLAYMEHYMARTADISGTGAIIKPDLAIMNVDPWGALTSLLSKSQLTYNVPLGTTSPELAKFPTIRVGGMDCVLDKNCADDKNDKEVVFTIDSSAFYIDTLNTKSEGLVEGQWKQNDPEIIGGVGTFKSNWTLICKTPQAVGVITDAQD